LTATTPSQQGQQHQLDDEQQAYMIVWHHTGISPITFIPTFTGKGRSGQKQLGCVQRDAKQWCMPLDWLGGGGLISRRGKSHIGNFGLAMNLSLFFLGRFCILCCVPHFIFWWEMSI
jgi:hypothetical protein